MIRKIAALLAAAVLAAVGLIATGTPVQANHLTGYDCEVNDEQRGPYSNISIGVRWSNSDTLQKLVSFRIHNWDNRPYTVTVRYQRFTDGHVYKQEGFVVASTSTIFVSGWENVEHSQVYHAGFKLYRDGTYIFSINLWYDAYRGNVTWVADLTNCTPQ